MTQAVFVLPHVLETSVRFLRAALDVRGARVGVVSQAPLERLGSGVAKRLAGHWQVDDALDPKRIVEGVRGIEAQMGRVDRLVGILEHLQVPLAEARAALGLPGLGVEAARRFRDKSHMKDVLREHGLPCARHRLAVSAAAAREFVGDLSGPAVVKPPEGAGAVNTFRVDGLAELEDALRAFPPSPTRPMLLEEFVVGEEHSFDSVTLGGRTVWHSISRYHPTPLDVLRNDWIQWCVLLPRSIDGPEFAAIRAAAPAALAALGLQDGLSHMEWFRRPDDSVAISEVGARPPGAQITSLMSWAHDADLYAAWARLVLRDEFDPPERAFAAGAAYFRGQGRGRVVALHGLDRAQAELGDLVVEARLPRPGQPRSSSYEGEGFAILRHAETRVVAEALERLVSLVRVEVA
jgi:hypothetical protein